MGSEKELHSPPPGSCSTADVPVPGVFHAHATGFVLHSTGHLVVSWSKPMKNKTNVPNVPFIAVAGYSGLVLDSTRSNLMCNCTDDNIYMFNVSGLKTTPGK